MIWSFSPGYQSTLFLLHFISIVKNTIIIRNYSTTKIFTRKGEKFPIQITVLFYIITRKQPAKLFQISQGKLYTEIRAKKLIFCTVSRPNKRNHMQKPTLYSKSRKQWVRKLRIDPGIKYDFYTSKLREMAFQPQIKQVQ